MTADAALPDVVRPSSFWIALFALGLISLCTWHGAVLSDLAGFVALVVSALLPGWCWCHRRAHGLPLYPIFTSATVGTFGLPLIAQHLPVSDYAPRERLLASLAVAASNVAGTVPWYLLTCRPPLARKARLEIRHGLGSSSLACILIITTLFNLGQTRLLDSVDLAIISILRAAVIVLSNLAIYLVAYRWGRNILTPFHRLSGAVLIGAVIVSTLPSALMVGALSYGLMALVGFALGRGRIPWLPLGALALGALFLQGGKEELRNKYWYGADAASYTVADYPVMLADWIGFSLAQLSSPSSPASTLTAEPEVDSQSLLQRASLLQLFLRIQHMSPGEVPYLHGRTYTIVPQLLVPRILNERKERTHEGTYMLAIHYGLQTTDETVTTTIGFGLINEAMANFGYAGCIGLALALGIFYGGVARWSAGCSTNSLRYLLGLIVLSVSFQNEFSLGVYVTTLFQGTCALLLFALPVIRRRRPATAVHSAMIGSPA